MIISIWRYSHLALAVSSFVFIALAALTGVILAFEPIDNQLKGYAVSGSSELPLAEVVDGLSDGYEEVLSLEVDQNGFVILSAIDLEGNMGDFYIDPSTGEKLGDIIPQAPIYEFVTALHRSLFLKGIGRFLVGLSAFCLFLIAFTGIILVAKRQQGIRHFFDRIINENFYQYSHIYLGRLALIPILLITLTGTYLSLQRFEVIPEGALTRSDIDYDALEEEPRISLGDFEIFQETRLGELRSIEFPFSSDVEDFFTLTLKDKELQINQVTGDVVAEWPFPLVRIFADLSLFLHTGRGSIWWSIVLGLASFSTLFFIYSGFKMTFQRRKGRLRNKLGKDECEVVILVGSETGTTLPFAMQMHMALVEQGLKSYVTELNWFTGFKSMKHLIVITSTHGKGEPPASATKFQQLWKANLPKNAFTFSVVGFGSLAYDDFCKYAFDVNQVIGSHELALRVTDVHTINNRSWESFRQWARKWGESVEVKVELPAQNPTDVEVKKTEKFRVLRKTNASESLDDTFIIHLQSLKSRKLQSGDLLGVLAPDDPYERLYSAAVSPDGNVYLSVKRHEFGVCSNYLNGLDIGQEVEARIIKNNHFHFPKKASKVMLIGTGTGIAPFLGMLSNNSSKVETHLYWGGRNDSSFELYKPYIEGSLIAGELSKFNPAYSRMGEKMYVQDLLAIDRELVAETLRNKGVIMICGSIAMQRDVLTLLEDISTKQDGKPLSYYQKRKQLRMDCY